MKAQCHKLSMSGIHYVPERHIASSAQTCYACSRCCSPGLAKETLKILWRQSCQGIGVGMLIGFLCFLMKQQTYPIDQEQAEFSQIGGPWITSARNIKFVDGVLCAALRTTQRTYEGGIGNLHSCINFYYNRDCYVVGNTPIKLANNAGKFVSYHGTENYELLLTSAQVSWRDSAHCVSYFPNNTICLALANDHKTNDAACAQACRKNDDDCRSLCRYTPHVQCMTYTAADYFINEHGKLRKFSHHDYLQYLYMHNEL